MFAQTFGHDDIPPWLSGCLRNDCAWITRSIVWALRRSGNMALMSLWRWTRQFLQWLIYWQVHWQNISLLQQMTVDIVVQPKNWLPHTSTHYSSRLIKPQAKLITPLGIKPQEDSLLMTIGKQWNWKSLLWKTLMLGLWLTGKTQMENCIMLFLTLGYSSANDIQMDALWCSKHDFVLEAINSSKGLISMRLMP